MYQTGRKVDANFKEKMTIAFDDFLPAWNYRAIPKVAMEMGKLFNSQSSAF